MRLLLSLGCMLSCAMACNAAGKSDSYADVKLSKAIDDIIHERIRENNIQPANPADGAELVRRVYLDVLGRVPTKQETLSYLQDTRADRQNRLIDSLLNHPEMALYWSDLLDRWLNGRAESQPGHAEFRAYLHAGLEANKSWQQFAREMLLPGIDPDTQPAAYFLGSRLKLPREEQLDGMTVAVAGSFFGVRLECAKCHDHPYVEEWRQDHYYGLAAFLARARLRTYKNKPVLAEDARGEVKFNTTDREEKVANIMFLDSKVFTPPELSTNDKENYLVAQGANGGQPSVPKFSALKTLADYAIRPDNPYFKRAMVNRIWKQLLGRGLVEPVDQIHSANPPSHPRILDLLANDFADHDFDLKRLIAVILYSDTYLRSSSWAGGDDRPDESLYAVARLRPLDPEQLSISLAILSGYADRLADRPQKSETDLTLPQRLRQDLQRDLQQFINLYHSEGEDFAATSSQALFFTYNKTVEKFLAPTPGLLAHQLAQEKDNAALAKQAYLTVLSRYPDTEETARLVRYLETGAGQSREQICVDIVWALVNSAEFRFNH